MTPVGIAFVVCACVASTFVGLIAGALASFAMAAAGVLADGEAGLFMGMSAGVVALLLAVPAAAYAGGLWVGSRAAPPSQADVLAGGAAYMVLCMAMAGSTAQAGGVVQSLLGGGAVALCLYLGVRSSARRAAPLLPAE